MNEIELWHGSTKALIDPIGGWLTNLSDDNGDVLFPKRNLTAVDGAKKQRGGCHVCLPNFGPGGDSDQPQHGFGREMIWEIVETQPSQAVLTLPAGKDDYETLRSTLTYTLDGRSIDIALKLENTGEKSLRVAPGFHPYFVLDRNEEEVNLNGQVYETINLAGTEFFDDKDSMHLQLNRHNIATSSHNLPTWAFWTDKLDDYVCVEPTVGGYTFLEKQSEIETLVAGETQTYSMTISW